MKPIKNKDILKNNIDFKKPQKLLSLKKINNENLNVTNSEIIKTLPLENKSNINKNSTCKNNKYK